MVIEVTSPSTRKRDFGKKLEKYVDAGVRECWIADVKVPVGIYDGECKIDFEEIVNSVVNI